MEYGRTWIGDEEREETIEEGEEPQFRIRYESYKVPEGGIAKVKITDSYVEIQYPNGSFEVIPIEELRFCPECLREGYMPFTSSYVCPYHEIRTLEYSEKEFRAFEEAYRR